MQQVIFDVSVEAAWFRKEIPGGTKADRDLELSFKTLKLQVVSQSRAIGVPLTPTNVPTSDAEVAATISGGPVRRLLALIAKQAGAGSNSRANAMIDGNNIQKNDIRGNPMGFQPTMRQPDEAGGFAISSSNTNGAAQVRFRRLRAGARHTDRCRGATAATSSRPIRGSATRTGRSSRFWTRTSRTAACRGRRSGTRRTSAPNMERRGGGRRQPRRRV